MSLNYEMPQKKIIICDNSLYKNFTEGVVNLNQKIWVRKIARVVLFEGQRKFDFKFPDKPLSLFKALGGNKDKEIREYFGLEDRVNSIEEIRSNTQLVLNKIDDFLFLPIENSSIYFIVGYNFFNGVMHVFFIKHERNDSDDYVLDAQPLNIWKEDDLVYGLGHF